MEVTTLNANDTPVIGANYHIRLTSGSWITATFTGTYVARYSGRQVTRYCFTNIRTGRNITLKSRAKIGSRIIQETAPQIDGKSLGAGDN
jgi:hypothetical protein